jgi:hypothetical protein
VSQLGRLVLGGLGLPLGGVLLGRDELGVLTDGGVGVGEDLLNVLGTDTVSEVGGELLLEPESGRLVGSTQRRVASFSESEKEAKRKHGITEI